MTLCAPNDNNNPSQQTEHVLINAALDGTDIGVDFKTSILQLVERSRAQETQKRTFCFAAEITRGFGIRSLHLNEPCCKLHVRGPFASSHDTSKQHGSF